MEVMTFEGERWSNLIVHPIKAELRLIRKSEGRDYRLK